MCVCAIAFFYVFIMYFTKFILLFATFQKWLYCFISLLCFMLYFSMQWVAVLYWTKCFIFWCIWYILHTSSHFELFLLNVSILYTYVPFIYAYLLFIIINHLYIHICVPFIWFEWLSLSNNCVRIVFIHFNQITHI